MVNPKLTSWHTQNTLQQWKVHIFLCLLLGVFSVHVAHAHEEPDLKIDQIKVAYLVNFIRFTAWPDLNEQDHNKPLVITLLDNSQFVNLVSQAFPDQKCDGRPVVIQTISPTNSNAPIFDKQQQAMLKASHVIYMHDRSMAELKAIRQVEPNLTFLLIGDMPDFAESNGMIGLRQSQSGVSFTVNISQIRQAKIHVSSKVLRLGVTVRSKDDK